MASFIPELPSDSVEMCLVEIQNPSTMWLADAINKQISKKFYDMEERLKQVLDRENPKYCNRMLNVGDIVAVYDAVSDTWCRGKICDIYQKLSKFVYNVFLVDRGYSISSDPTNIKELPPEASTLQFRCYHVQLYGVIPISPTNNIASPENLELQAWLPESVTEVKNLLTTCEAVYFTPKVARRTVYGDVYLQFDCGFIRLASYLCDKEFAVYNTDSFQFMMETAPYMSCQQGFCSNSNKENRSISDYIKSSQDTDEAFSVQEENDNKHPCNDYEYSPSEYSKANEAVGEDNSPSSQSKPKSNKKRISALQQYYEEMRRGDGEHTGLNPSTVSDKGAVGQTAHKRHFQVIGRGERLQMLQNLYTGKKPGGSYSNKSYSDDVINKPEEEHILVDGLSNMSVNDNKSSGFRGKQFPGPNVFTNNVSNGKRIKMGSIEYPSQLHLEKQYNMKQPVHCGNLPTSNGSIFCRPSKLMFLPAGSEESMLVPKKKERQEKRYPNNSTAGKTSSSNTFTKIN